MTAFSAAAHDEGGDTTKALRARITELEDVLENLPLSLPQRLHARIQRLEEVLAAVGAGGVWPLIPATVQHHREPNNDNDLQRKTFDFSTTAAPQKTGGIPPDWLSQPEAEIALWQAMHKRNDWGNPADDKLVLKHLRSRGLWIGYKADQMVYPLGKLMDDEIARVKAEQEPQGEREPLTDEQRKDAERYRHLRAQPIDCIDAGGIFCGKTPENVVVNGEDLDAAVDAAIGIGQAATPQPSESAAYLLRDLAADIGVKALDLIAAIRDAGLGDYSINMMLPTRVCVAMCQKFAVAPQHEPLKEHEIEAALSRVNRCALTPKGIRIAEARAIEYAHNIRSKA